MTAPNREPLFEYLRVQGRLDDDLNRILARAASDAERRVRSLSRSPDTIGRDVRIAQLTDVLRAIREMQEKLWVEGIGPKIESSIQDAQEAANRAAEALERVLYASLPESRAKATLSTIRNLGEEGMFTDAARQRAELSPRVWRNAQLASGLIEARIRSGLIQGLTVSELADSVREFVHPSAPGGVAYAAKRLARTELNNAFHTRQVAAAQAHPWVRAVHWNLSRTHTATDTCNLYAEQNRDRLGRGNYIKTNVPDKPHPLCLCYLTYDLVSEAEFLEQMQMVVRS